MVYDKANELAKLLKESDEFREYKTTVPYKGVS